MATRSHPVDHVEQVPAAPRAIEGVAASTPVHVRRLLDSAEL